MSIMTAVLQEVVDSARALTGARYGVIATVDDSGRVRDFVTSGFTPDEHKQLADWPDGPRLFEHLRDLPGSLRLDDLPGYVRALGYSADLMRSQTFQGVPMRHRGEQVASSAPWTTLLPPLTLGPATHRVRPRSCRSPAESIWGKRADYSVGGRLRSAGRGDVGGRATLSFTRLRGVEHGSDVRNEPFQQWRWAALPRANAPCST